MWAELFLWNRDNLISEIDQFDAALGALRSALAAGDREKLEEMFRLSTQRRAAFDKKLPNEVNLCPSRKARNQAVGAFAHL